MSERGEQRREEFRAREERIRARKEELAPVFARVALLGRNTYESLRPLALHIGSAERDYPLRHQQVHGLAPSGGPGGIVSDYLMVGFGDHHGLLLYKDFNPRNGTWRFERTVSTREEALQTEKMDLKELPVVYQREYGLYDIEVSRYKYAERIGLNAMHDAFVCSYFNEYEGAETFLASMEADFNEALADHS